MKKLILIALLFFVTQTNAQIITTIAGTGTAGWSGDGGQATAANMYYPGKIILDATGNLYFCDIENAYIRKINTSGIISSVVGNGTNAFSGDGGQATAASLFTPGGMVFDASGNLYVADGNNNRIRKVNTAGIINSVAGNGTGAYSGDGGQATAAALWNPTDVAIDALGNLYISESANNTIRKVTTAGIISTFAGGALGGYGGDGGQATAAKLNTPRDITFDAAGNLYIADSDNMRIRKVSTSGIITTIAGTGTQSFGGDGGVATAAKLNQPFGINFDAAGNLYIGDEGNNRIRKINTAGIITTIAGGGSSLGDGWLATAAQLSIPEFASSSATGYIYISDTYHNRIRRISPPLTVTVNSSTICVGGSTTLTASGGTTYSWSPSTGLSTAAGSVVVANPTVTTNYSVVATSGIAMGGAIATVTVYPSALVVNSPSICIGSTATLTISGASTYSWSPATNLSASTGSVVVATPTANTTYTITGTMNSCTATAISTVTVNPLPIPSFTTNAVCKGAPITFNNTTPNQGLISKWHWDFGDGITTSTLASPSSYTYAAAGIYSVVLTATTALGCSNSITNTVTVHANPSAQGSFYNACLGSASNFTDASAINNPSGLNDAITNWSWNFGDGYNSTLPAPSHTYAACGIYSVALTVKSNFNCTNTMYANDTVFCLPTVSAPPSFSICPGTPVNNTQTTFTVTGAAPQYGTPETIYFVNNPNPTTKTHGGIPLADTVGYNSIPNYNAIAQNLSCGLLIDTIYGYAVTVSNGSLGCIGNSATFTISVYPTPTVTTINDVTVCANDMVPSATFNGCPLGETFSWTNSNTSIGLTSSGLGNIAAFPGQNTGSMPNIGTVDVTPLANGCSGLQSTFTITVNPLPGITITSPAPYCPGDLISATDYNINTTPVSGVTYTWTATNYTNIGMPASGTGAAPNTAYSAPVNISLTNQVGVVSYTPMLHGCIGATTTETITIKPTPIMQTIPNQYWCPGSNTSAVTFATQPVSASTTYNWSYDTGAGIPSIGNSNMFPSLPTSNNGLTTLIATVTVAATLNNCIGPDATFYISVYPNPIAKFMGSHTSVCDGHPITFTDESVAGNGNTINQWAWDFNNDGSIDASAQNPNYTMGGSGSFPVTLLVGTNSVPSCTAQVTEQVYVNPIPVVAFTGDTLSGCSVLSTNFADMSTVANGTISSWNWNFGNGNTSNTQLPPSQHYINNSTSVNAYFTVSLTVISDSGCSNTATKPNYIDVLACATNGIQSFNSTTAQINLYPNPNNGSFFIEPANNIQYTIYVYDVNGKLVLTQTINGKTSIDANNLNDGVYNVSIISSEGVVNKRMVIVR